METFIFLTKQFYFSESFKLKIADIKLEENKKGNIS